MLNSRSFVFSSAPTDSFLGFAFLLRSLGQPLTMCIMESFATLYCVRQSLRSVQSPAIVVVCSTSLPSFTICYPLLQTFAPCFIFSPQQIVASQHSLVGPVYPAVYHIGCWLRRVRLWRPPVLNFLASREEGRPRIMVNIIKTVCVYLVNR